MYIYHVKNKILTDEILNKILKRVGHLIFSHEIQEIEHLKELVSLKISH